MWAAVLLPSPARFGDDHLSSYLMKLHPETHVLEGDHNGALRVGLQAGGRKCLTWCFHVYREIEKTVTSDRQEGSRHEAASPAQRQGPEMEHPCWLSQYPPVPAPPSTGSYQVSHAVVTDGIYTSGCSLLPFGHGTSQPQTTAQCTALVQLRELNAVISPIKVPGAAESWGVCATINLLKKTHYFSSKAFCYLVGSEGIKAFPTGLFLVDKLFCKDLCVVKTQLDFLYSKTQTGR